MQAEAAIVIYKYHPDYPEYFYTFDDMDYCQRWLDCRSAEQCTVKVVTAWCPVPEECLKGMKDKDPQVFRVRYRHRNWNNGESQTQLLDCGNEMRLWYNRNIKKNAEFYTLESVEVAAACEEIPWDQIKLLENVPKPDGE